MASVLELMKTARNRQQNKEASERFKQILSILQKHEVLRGLTPEKAVALLEDLGPSFVKLGQIASTHPDVLPKEYCDAFAQLRANATPLAADVVHKQIADELGKPVDELFAEFDDTPIGSASIAQVHRATLKDSGAVVAVKVQRPGVAETVTNDLVIMERLVDLYGLVVHDDQQISLKELVEELERTSLEELDFTCEERNLIRFYDNNHDRTGIESPKAYTDYSNQAILTEDFFDAPRAGQIEDMGFSAEEREQLGYLIAHNYVEQIMEDGFYHADPHAGNILIKPDGSGIQWIDFGMMGTLTSSQRQLLRDIMSAVGSGNAYNLERYILRIAEPKGAINYSSILSACERVLDEYVNTDLQSFDLSKLLSDISGSMKGNGLEVQPFVTMLSRGLVTLEGTIRLITPQLNIMQVVTTYMTTRPDFGELKNRARKFAATSLESVEAATSLPLQASNTLDMLQKGQIRVGGNVEVDERLSKGLSSVLNNFSIAVIAAALFLGSCIMCLTNMQPLIWGVPLIGFFGFLVGIALMVYVVVRIVKPKEKK